MTHKRIHLKTDADESLRIPVELAHRAGLGKSDDATADYLLTGQGPHTRGV